MDSINKVSIIIPIYNVAPYLEECLFSVATQTYQNLEVILVDDCGSDNSMEIAESFILSYDGPIVFKIIHHECNKGLSAARNTGVMHASGEFISFIDSDDYVQKWMYERFVECFKVLDSSFFAVACRCYSVKDGETFTDDNNYDKPTIIWPQEYLSRMLSSWSLHTAWAKCFRRNIYNKVMFREGKTNEDVLFHLDLSKLVEEQGLQMYVIPDRLYYYRQHQNSITASIDRPIIFSVIDNMEEILAYLKKQGSFKYEVFISQKKEYFNVLLQALVFCSSHGRWSDFKRYRKKLNSFDGCRVDWLNNAAQRTVKLIKFTPHFYYLFKKSVTHK